MHHTPATAAADPAWADPAWQLDSTTRTCCGGIGSHTRDCTAPEHLAAIPVPADAQHVEDWIDWNNTGDYERHMHGTRRAVAGVEIRIAGFQQADGIINRHATVWATDTYLDATALRQLAAAALTAADELDELGPIAYTLTDRLDS
ncbi:hypothetical protein [Mycolicibacterium neworleansense]|uniref:Uncharacterized protein n=1 Tax=Mycolicibacterium neworleansense TaxID=146018 RepID=A0A0H5RLB7_9MYCO|nr:hypothetical protein [Mycolicibacterium neworleansense]MCV7363862.1 hypothetical protein [Mycolicibacterium neworleansense]CRZ14798.1 hypothetical protein BN2156_01653 [Mycolicibacterium neworleansense]